MEMLENVGREYIAQVVATGRFTAEEAGALVLPLLANARVLAPIVGEEPAEYLRRRLRGIVGETASPESLWRTLGTESPNFKKLFGESKVVDAEGKPLVVYHATDFANIQSFDRAFLESATKANTSAKEAANLAEHGLNGDWYERSAGEIEARDVQARMGMNEKKRRAIAPDLQPDAIVAWGGQEAAYSLGQALPVFYSQLERVLSAKLSNGTAAQHLKTLDAWAKKGEFKGEELEWSGLKEWLAAKGDEKVSKSEVLDFLRQGGVKVEEVVKGGEDTGFHRTLSPEEMARYHELLNITGGQWDDVAGGYVGARERTSEEDTEFRQLNARVRADANDYARRLNSDTEFSKYQIPGGENYRELLLTFPRTYERVDGFYVEDSIGTRIAYYADRRRAMEWAQLMGGRVSDQGPREKFFSPHFSESNILAHVRFNERTDVEGKRVLFIEEIQSDWAQKGRKDGFGSLVSDRAAMIEFGFMPEEWAKFDVVQKNQYRAAAAQRRGAAIVSVPDAPFVKNTAAWSMLAMKRMIRWAAENGFDRIAWTTGEQQAERYDLGQHLDRIEYEPNYDEVTGEKTGTYEIFAEDKAGNRVFEEEDANLDRIEEIAGKEIAQKIQNDEGSKETSKHQSPYREWKALTGFDLRVGGEGMKGFYDKILPSETNKLIKKWGGKVGESRISVGKDFRGSNYALVPARDVGFNDNSHVAVNIDTNEVVHGPGDADALRAWIRKEKNLDTKLTVHSFDITDQMREGALAGQALFQYRVGSEKGWLSIQERTDGVVHSSVMGLMSGSDVSTFLHEGCGHLFLENLREAALSSGAPEWLREDWRTVKAEFDIPNDRHIPVASHEAFAEAAEIYFLEGRAPAKGLSRVFGLFRNWLSAIPFFADRMGVRLDEQVRGVFDRLLVGRQDNPESQEEEACPSPC